MNCALGDHAALVEREPQDLGGCVNIDWHCPACGQRVRVVSWGKADWLVEQAKVLRKLDLLQLMEPEP